LEKIALRGTSGDVSALHPIPYNQHNEIQEEMGRRSVDIRLSYTILVWRTEFNVHRSFHWDVDTRWRCNLGL